MLTKRLLIAVIAMSFAGSAQASELMSTMHHHYLLGKWSCIGHVHTPDGQRMDTVGSWKIKRVFHGHVYDKFENHTGDGFTYVAKGMTRYDKLAGVLNRHVISNMGTWTRYVSSGWDKEGTLTWAGESYRFGRKPVAIEQVVTKTDDNTLELRVRVPGQDGKDGSAKNMYRGTCTRTSAPGGHKDGGKDDGVDDDENKQDDTVCQGDTVCQMPQSNDGDEDYGIDEDDPVNAEDIPKKEATGIDGED